MALDHNTFGRMRKGGAWALAFLFLLFVNGQRASGQVDEGSITGTIQDPSGAIVANANVTLHNTDQGIELKTKTNANGGYTFAPVRAGHYTLTVEASGFAKTTQQNLTVNVAQTLQVNIQLKVGSATETVQVTTAPPLLQTEEASVGQVIDRQEVNDLPLNGRNFTFLAQLGAGMQTPEADTRGNAQNGAFSANGLKPAQNNYLLDGIDNNSNAVDFLNGTNYVILPPVDAIQEFKVQTADYSAELGRAAGAVMNATIKSGTNSLHGDVWEFFRNDIFDANDWFTNNTAHPIKDELRENQFGVTVGGPIIKNKLFFFGDYEGKRRVLGTTFDNNVPTATERSSGYTNFVDILSENDGTTRPDILGRAIQKGAILDPATTRFVAKGAVDPVSGLTNNSGADGYVREPFSSICGPGVKTFTLTACSDLNQLPSARLDSNAIKLLNLYPAPQAGNTYVDAPKLFEHSNSFDTREDFNPTASNQIFARFSYSDDPQFIPGPFSGVADGGAFQQGVQTAKSMQGVAAFTHVFTPQTVNQARAGLAHLHTTRYGPVGSQMGIPAQYGVQGIPQVAENGGLPNYYISGLTNLGSNNFLPSDEVSQTLQVTDDFTKIYGQHSFKMGVEYQHVKFSTLQPAWSRGAWDYGSGPNSQTAFTDIPTDSTTTTGMPQMLLPPAAAPATIAGNPNPNGFSYSGGADNVYASNINKTYDEKMYIAEYFQDDWKISPKLTINLGLRWDYFGPINETNGGQANFVPYGPPNNVPEYIVPATGKDNRSISTSSTCQGTGCYGLSDLLAKDGITLVQTDKYGQGLVQVQKHNLAPRIGFAWQATPKVVARGGFGLFYNSFENQGYSPNLGENYPFVFNHQFYPQVASTAPSVQAQVAPTSFNTPFSGCATGGPGGTASLESGFSCISLTPSTVDARGLGLGGTQFNYQTPRDYAANLTLQYSIRPTLSAQAAYVYTQGQDLQALVGYKNVPAILPAGASTTPFLPFADFGSGSYAATVGESIYNGLQTKLEQQFANGITYLLTYTFSKTMSDAGDQLNGGSEGNSPYRAYGVPGLGGAKFDWSPANYNIRQVLHFSGGYQLPFGRDKRWMNQGRATNTILGGWAVNWILTLQGGQPINFNCPTGTAAGATCFTMLVPGANPQYGIKTKTLADGSKYPFWIGNPQAFTQPCELGYAPGYSSTSLGVPQTSPIVGTPSGCIPLNGSAALGSKPGNISGPGFHRFDFSAFKDFHFTERYYLQFRAEFFNIANHPNFNAPNFSGNGVVGVSNSGNYTDPHFGAIGATRDNPYDPRQIQFAAKIYY